MNINFVDILIILIFVSSMIYGFSRGFVREVVSFIALVAAIAVAILFSNQLATIISNSATIQHLINRSAEQTTQEPSYIVVAISFFILFLGTLIIGAIIGLLLNAIFNVGVLGFGNRFMGAIFGLIRGFIYVFILAFIIHLTAFSNEEWWKQSRFITAMQPTIDWMDDAISPVLTELKTKVEKTFEKTSPEEEAKPASSEEKPPAHEQSSVPAHTNNGAQKATISNERP